MWIPLSRFCMPSDNQIKNIKNIKNALFLPFFFLAYAHFFFLPLFLFFLSFFSGVLKLLSLDLLEGIWWRGQWGAHSSMAFKAPRNHFRHFRWFCSKWSFKTTWSTCLLLWFLLFICSSRSFHLFISFVHFILSLRNGFQTLHVRIANETMVLRQTDSDWLSRLHRW